MLQMLRWLDRAPETFVRPCSNVPAVRLPDVGAGEVLRFDAAAIYAALEARRVANRWTWPQLAAAIGGVSASMLTHFATGGRVSVPSVIRVIAWLGRPVADFTRPRND